MDWASMVESVKEALAPRVLDIGGKSVTVGTLLVFTLILVSTWLISRLARKGLARWMKRSGIATEGSTAVTQRLVHYAIVLGGLVAALQTIGIDLSTLFAAGAVFAVGLGFAMQNIAQNFVSGVILMAERSIKPGDILLVEEQIVRVEKMGIRATIVRNRDEEELIVPNSLLVQAAVKNFTLTDSEYLLRAEVGVVYGSDMKLVREVLEETARAVPWRLQKEDPRVLMKQFGSSSVDFQIFVWVDDPWRSRRLLSDLNERIWFALKERGITIAFPQLDVHFDPEVKESLTSLGGRRSGGEG